MASFHNPLSLAVPPTELQRWYREQMVLKMQEASSNVPSLKDRSRSFSGSQAPAHPASSFLRSLSFTPQSSREKGDSHVSREHQIIQQWQRLTQQPRPWSSEFLGLETLPRGYSVPATWHEGKQRIMLNLDQYWGNYMRLLLFILFSSFYKQPVAMLGIYLLWRLSEELHRQWLDYSGSRRGWRWAFIRWSIYSLMWVVALYFRVISATVIGLSVSCGAVALHGTFREPSQLQLKSK